MMKRLIGRATQLAVTSALFAGTSAVASTNTEPEFVPGEYVVKIKDNYSLFAQNSGLVALSTELRSYIKSTIPGQNMVVVKRPVIETKDSALKSIGQSDLVEFVEPNYIYHATKTPNDPMLGQLWGMKNTGQNDSANQAGIAGVDIGAEKAWDIETGSKNVLVAVIDTGISYNSPELKDNVWTNKAEANGVAGVDDDSNGYIDDIHGYNFVANTGDPLDDQGHGSHCSGTIGAKGNDGQGLVGVNWDVQIMGVKFLDKNGSGSLENAVKAIDYATKMGAKIMSNSWGGGGASDALKAAIERSNKAGALFVAAAGNDSNDNDAKPTYPASYPVDNILAVAAIDNKGVMASFSNYGKSSVHVGAPGVNIVSVTTAGFESWSGTSMATPHVSGIAALLAAHEPNLSNLDLKNRITQTAKPIAGLRGKVKSGGLANAYLALTNTIPQPDPNDPVNWQSTTLNISSAHPYADNSNVTYDVSVPGAKQISIYFAKFETERGYDNLEIYDSKGNKVQVVSGVNNDTYSSIIDGDSAKLILKSDKSITKYGFDITKAAFR